MQSLWKLSSADKTDNTDTNVLPQIASELSDKMSCQLNVIWLSTAQKKKKKMLPDKVVRYNERLLCWLCCLHWDSHGVIFFIIKVLLHFCVTENCPRRNAAFVFFPTTPTYPRTPTRCSRLWFKLCSHRFQGCMRLVKKKKRKKNWTFLFTYCNNFDSRAQMVFCFIKVRLIFQPWFDQLGSRSPSS